MYRKKVIIVKVRVLDPWLKGNGSVTSKNFYGQNNPDIKQGAFIALDIAIDLHLANTVDTGNLKDSWNKTKAYIEQACDIANVDSENDFDLDHEEQYWILSELGAPPECCYNIYIITVYNEYEEKIVYIGKTDAKESRFKNGHLAALKLHDPKYKKYYKRVYFGMVMFLDSDKEHIPLEFITPYSMAEQYLGEMEAVLINHFAPELNTKNERINILNGIGVIHIQNFTDVSDFLHDYFITVITT